MSYDDKKTFNDFERELQIQGNAIINTLTKGEELFKDLSAYKSAYGNNAEIATKLNVSEAYIDDLETTVVAMHRLFDAGEGTALTTADYFDDLRKFT
jgi:hypothetical protein